MLAPRAPARVRISGTDDSGWMPIDLTEVAEAITVLQRLAGHPGDAVAGPLRTPTGSDGRGSLPTQPDAPVAESLPGA